MESNSITYENQKRDLMELSYSERQLIVVVPDEVKVAEYEALKKNIEETNASESKTFSWDAVTKILLASIGSKLFVWGTAIELAIDAIKAIQKLRQKKIDVLTVGASDSTELDFPPGHPQKKAVYAGSPVFPRAYFPVGDFHRMMLESKFSEAIYLLMSLGACEIKAEKITGMDKTKTMSIDLETPVEAANASASSSACNERSLIFQSILSPNGPPVLPDNLVWYQYEPTWRLVAEGRTKFRMKNFSLNVSYQDDYGINTELKTSLEGVGLGVGGGSTEHQSTVWNIKGQFSDQN